MKLAPYSLISGYDKQIIPKLGPQSILNMYIIYNQDQENPPALYDLPGIRINTTIGPDPRATCRGAIVEGDFIYAVYGSQIYRIDSNNVQIPIGSSLSTDQGVVIISKNETQIMFVDGVEGYIWNYKTNIATFPIPRTDDNPFPFQPISVTNVAGFFVVAQGESNFWYWSGPNNGLVWPPGQFILLLAQGDVMQAVSTVNNKLFIFGKTACAQWFVDPISNDLPFQENTNMLLGYGSAARGAVSVNFDVLVWLSSTKNGVDSVQVSNGSFPRSITPPEIESIFKDYEKKFGVSDAVSMIYKNNGHVFYEINFKAANHTWVCDITSVVTNDPNSGPDPKEGWFERLMSNGNRFIGQNYVERNGMSFLGSNIDNRLFEMSKNYGDYDGDVFLRRVVGSTWINKSLRMSTIARWQFDLDMGTGSPTGPQMNPILYFSLSFDSGETFGNKRQASMGAIGQRTKRLWYDQLGTAQMFTPMLEFYNNVPTAIVSSVITYEECGV